MAFMIAEKAFEILTGQFSGLLSTAAIRQLVENTWEELPATGTYVCNRDDTQRLFCLPMRNNRQNAVFIQAALRDDVWTAFFIMFRVPGTRHPRSDKDPFSPALFSLFPDLEERLETLSITREERPANLTGGLEGPESLDADALMAMLDAACANYADKPYFPAAYGFNLVRWKETVLRYLLEQYPVWREQGRILRLSDALYVCDTKLTNANSEWLYLFFGTHKDETVCRLYPPRTVHLSFPDQKNTFYAFSTRMHDYQKSYSLLGEWAYIHDDDYRRLEKIILPEAWHLTKKTGESDNLRAIKRYVEGTFIRLLNEEKIMMLDEKYQPAESLQVARYAVFNSGLVDSMYRPIYAFFRRNSQEKPLWKLDAFTQPNQGIAKPLQSQPERAQYFVNLQDMFYDMLNVPNARTPDVDHTHVLFDRFERLPANVQKRYLGERYAEYRLAVMSGRRDDAQSLVDGASPQKKKRLKEVFDRALETSLNRAEWNYRTGVPMYYIRDGIMTMLLPLAMEQELNVDDWETGTALSCDLALVMALEGPAGNKRYKAKTILSLDMAYANARLVTRPDSDWLNPMNIVASDVPEDD